LGEPISGLARLLEEVGKHQKSYWKELSL